MNKRIDHKWECYFKNGRIIFDDPEKVMSDCYELEGKKGFCHIKPFRKSKSDRQHRYYFGVVVRRFSEYWGCTIDEAHSALSAHHLKVIPENEEMPEYIRSTSFVKGGWTTDEWEGYMEKLRYWAITEFGLYIELPNEVDLSEIKNVF